MDTVATGESLQRFVFERVLNQDPRAKSLILLGSISPEPPAKHHPKGTAHPAVLRIEKRPFTSEQAVDLVNAQLGSVAVRDRNDCYYWLDGWSAPSAHAAAPDLKMELIYPATALHIAKYAFQPRRLILETPQLYQTAVLPYIASLPMQRIQWVYNILEGRSEQDKILANHLTEDGQGFVVLPDSKWDGATMEGLYLLVLCQQRNIGSLRDLDASHLPLLIGIQAAVRRVVQARYPQVRPDEVRLFVHYQPSYYHFHVHAAHVRHEAAGVMIGQAHLLSTVIDNITNICSDYYQKCTLEYALAENHALFPYVAHALEPN
ncbi:hypothetical protein H4R35_000869 [Dimargaris xerosporica]|nr:hypothetical protein H4R35_000869 [Dimargaris xerosporica]